MSKLIDAVTNDDLEEVKNLVKAGEDIKYVNKYDNTCLIVAINRRNKEIAKYLIKEGACEDLRANEISVLVSRCMSYELYTLAKILVEKGANVNYVSDEDISLLELACLYGNLRMVKYLVENGASLRFSTFAEDAKERKNIALRCAKLGKNKNIINYINKISKETT